MSTVAPQPAPTAQPVRPKNRVARAALTIAIIAFVLGCIPFVGFVSWLVAVAAIVVAIIALTRGGLPKGGAIAALVVGVVALIVGPSVAITSVVAAVSGAHGAAAAGIASSAAASEAAPISEQPSASAEASDAPSAQPSEEAAASNVPTKTYKGTGDKVVKVDYSKPIVVTFTCKGCSSNTTLKTDSGFDTLPVNTIGAYTGRHIFNTSDNSLLTRFIIGANARWSLKIEDPSAAGLKRVSVGGSIKGTGDDVIFVEDGVSDSDVENHGDSNFALKSYGGTDSLPVNEIGSYRGNVVLNGPAIVQVESNGSWKIKGNG